MSVRYVLEKERMEDAAGDDMIQDNAGFHTGFLANENCRFVAAHH